MPISQAFQPPPGLISQSGPQVSRRPGTDVEAAADEGTDVARHLKVQLLVRAYQSRGHHKAKTDPLGIRGEADAFGYRKPKELELEVYGFTEGDLDKDFKLGPGILPRFITETRKTMKLREIVAACDKI